ncbi:MAG: site-specific integrase [Candidatus Bathyarchaeota archaeon]|nr:site-specific integrase [Candidatus Bathyarchaeota archaeon]
MATKMLVEDFLDYIKKSRAKSTYKEYKHGINHFCKWFKKTPDEVLEMRRQDWTSGDLHRKRRFSREVEKFHKWMIDEGYSINTARTQCLGIRQLFRFFEMPLTYLSREVSKTVPTTRDFIPTIQQIRKMFKVADNLRDKLIISLGKDLGWRIGDFSKIKRDELPDLNEDSPILFERITEKEEIIAKSFISQESVDLLKEYLPTVTHRENPFLFPSNGKGHYDEESINRRLRDLAKKANVTIPKHKRLRFHAFRKRFLTECANLHIDINTAKRLVGKDVEESMLTYLSEVEHRTAFIKLHQRMRLTDMPMRKRTSQDAAELEERLDKLERLLYGVIAVGGKDLVERAKQMTGIDAFMTAKQLEENLIKLGELERKKQQEEYKRLIEENNNNNH